LLTFTVSLGANDISSGFLDFLSIDGENADVLSLFNIESTFRFKLSDIEAV
jgi:hypothetical protein